MYALPHQVQHTYEEALYRLKGKYYFSWSYFTCWLLEAITLQKTIRSYGRLRNLL